MQENSIYDGEVYDARLEDLDWCRPGVQLAGRPGMQWITANAVEEPAGKLTAQPQEPIKVVETLQAVAIHQPRPGCVRV